MIARIAVEWYPQKDKLQALTDEQWALLAEALPDIFPKERNDSFIRTSPVLAELETDGQLLAEMGIEYVVKSFKGAVKLPQLIPGTVHQVQVKIPNFTLLSITKVKVLHDCCTDVLQLELDDGWRILCVCPPNDQRRPDYIVGYAGHLDEDA